MNPGRPGALQQNAAAGAGAAQSSGSGQAATSREWRREEHGRFMQALEMFGSGQTGDEWKKITAFVGTRSIDEVRLHGRQYLQRLVQQLPPSPIGTTPARYLSSAGSQNDPNRQNYQMNRAVVPAGKGKRGASQQAAAATSALSAAAFEAAQAMNILTPVQFPKQLQQQQQLRLQQQQAVAAASHRNGRRPKAWTFQEDKAFETALAGWTQAKPYSWTKIAEALPGKSAKDVKNRYEKLVGDISSIEIGAVPVTESSSSSSTQNSPMLGRGSSPQPQGSTSSLSQRAVPPPPIEVPPRNISKDGAVGGLQSSTRSRRGSVTGGISMLSPTFLDMLANEAENEEKSTLPSFSGLSSLPSPLFSPSLLPSGSPGFFSPDKKSRGARAQQDKDKKTSSLDSSGGTKMEDIDTSSSADKTDEPQRSSTPRIWKEFLADDFKFDDSLTPIHSSKRKTPRSKPTAGLSEQSSKKASESGKNQHDVEMTDASAA